MILFQKYIITFAYQRNHQKKVMYAADVFSVLGDDDDDDTDLKHLSETSNFCLQFQNIV